MKCVFANYFFSSLFLASYFNPIEPNEPTKIELSIDNLFECIINHSLLMWNCGWKCSYLLNSLDTPHMNVELNYNVKPWKCCAAVNWIIMMMYNSNNNNSNSRKSTPTWIHMQHITAKIIKNISHVFINNLAIENCSK